MALIFFDKGVDGWSVARWGGGSWLCFTDLVVRCYK